MTQVFVVCEGQTEMSFVTEALASYFEGRQLYLKPRLIGKGGNVTYTRLLASLKPLLLAGQSPYCTTFIDYYGLPAGFPGKRAATKATSLSDKADCIYTALHEQLATENQMDEYMLRRFVPYVQMHEFEGLLFSDPKAFARAIDKPKIADELLAIRNRFETPEHINDNPNTAPSKQVISIVKEYEKVTMGTSAALEIGPCAIRQSCPLFSEWLDKLTALSAT
ncbi:MAG: DUF4276 family protein [Chloroflexi bacterium]|nr:DUF4276 family protein [Chloroflexota bacterium]